MTLIGELLGVLTAVILALTAGLGWAIFAPSKEPVWRNSSHYWSITYIDEDGVLMRMSVRVIDVLFDRRRLKVWCYARGGERNLKLSKIIDACDLNNGSKIDLQRWLESYRSDATSSAVAA